MVNIETDLDRNKQRQTTTIIGICRSSAVLHRQKTMGLQNIDFENFHYSLLIYLVLRNVCTKDFCHEFFQG